MFFKIITILISIYSRNSFRYDLEMKRICPYLFYRFSIFGFEFRNVENLSIFILSILHLWIRISHLKSIINCLRLFIISVLIIANVQTRDDIRSLREVTSKQTDGERDRFGEVS